MNPFLINLQTRVRTILALVMVTVSMGAGNGHAKGVET